MGTLAVQRLGEPTSRRARKRRILLVDDDVAVLRAERRSLSRFFHVETAATPQDAAVLLSVAPFDVIVTDFDMPSYNGLWLLGQVASRYPEMVRVMISGNESALFSPHLDSGLIQVFQNKPFSPENLLLALQST